MFRTFALIAVTAFVAGCAAYPGLKPLAPDDPANPQAPEAPMTSIAAPLTLEPPPAAVSDTGAPAPATVGPRQQMDMKGMDMPGMRGMGHDHTHATTQPGNTAPDMEGMHHHSHPGSATQPTTTQPVYTCKMHPQVVSDHPGKCPICGMKLIAKEGGK